MSELTEYKRLAGVGPSLMTEAAEADPMLELLMTAFSTKVRPADVRFIRYRKVKHGVEMEDMAERLGGILTSIEGREAEPREVIAYLKKHGAKPMKDEEEQDESVDVQERWTLTGRKELTVWGRDRITEAWKAIKDVTKATAAQVVEVLKQDPKILERYIHLLVSPSKPKVSKLPSEFPKNLIVLGFEPAFEGEEEGLDPVLATIKVGTKITVMRRRIYGDDSHGSPAAEKESVKTVAKVQNFGKADSIIVRFKSGKQGGGKKFSGTEYSKGYGRAFRVEAGRSGYTVSSGPPKPVKYLVLAIDGKDIDKLRKGAVSEGDEEGQGQSDDAGWAARRHAIDFTGKSQGDVGHTILQQMGGAGRLKSMIGAHTFITHPDGLSFKFPNPKATLGNYVKVTLTTDDLYDMEFMRLVKYDARPVKKYTGLSFDQLIPVFQKQTGLRLHL